MFIQREWLLFEFEHCTPSIKGQTSSVVVVVVLLVVVVIVVVAGAVVTVVVAAISVTAIGTVPMTLFHLQYFSLKSMDLVNITYIAIQYRLYSTGCTE